MKDLLNLLSSGDYTTFIILSLIFIFVWLFKDMKKSLLETKKSDLDFIDQSIESYAQSLKAIYLYLNNSINENDLIGILYSSYKYFDKNVLDIIDKFTHTSYIITSEEKATLLINLSKELKCKLSILKDKQLHITINKNYKLTIFDFLDSTSKNNFDIYCNAFLFSLIILTISYSAFEIIIVSISNHENIIPLIIYIFMFMFWILSIQISIDLLIKKCYKKIYLFILFLVLPLVLTYFILICKYYIIKIILLTIFIITVVISFSINVVYSKSLYKK
jgi:hypothetical protein